MSCFANVFSCLLILQLSLIFAKMSTNDHYAINSMKLHEMPQVVLKWWIRLIEVPWDSSWYQYPGFLYPILPTEFKYLPNHWMHPSAWSSVFCTSSDDSFCQVSLFYTTTKHFEITFTAVFWSYIKIAMTIPTFMNYTQLLDIWFLLWKWLLVRRVANDVSLEDSLVTPILYTRFTKFERNLPLGAVIFRRINKE